MSLVKRLGLALLVHFLMVGCINSDDLAGQGSRGSGSATPIPIINQTPPIEFAGIKTAFPIAHDKIVVTFAAGSGGGGTLSYRAYINNNFAIPNALTNLYVDNSGDINAIVSGLTTGTNYKIVVRAFDGLSEDKNVASQSATTLFYTTPDFAGLTSLTAAPGIPGKTTLTAMWNSATPPASASISAYNVYTRTPTGTYNFNTPKATISAPATQINITGLVQGAEYFVTVRAKDSNGHEEKNRFELSATTNISQPIGFLGLQSALPSSGVSGFTSIDLSWISATGDFDQYQVFQSLTDPSGLSPVDVFWTTPTKLINDTASTSTSMGGLTANTTYYFVVRAKDTGGSLTDGNQFSVQAITTPPAPTFSGATTTSIPAGLSGATSVTVHWDPAVGAFNQYQIFQKNGGVYNFGAVGLPDLVGTVGGGATSFTVGALTTNTQYCFVVRASNSSPFLTETNTKEVCGTPIVAPPSFGGITSCTPTDSSTITLNWSAATGVFDDYRVWRQPGSTLDITDATTANYITAAGNTSYPATGLTPGTTYTFIAKAHYSVAGNGPASMDSNTVYVNCTTPATTLTFDVYPVYRGSSNNFFTAAKVCNRDGIGNLVMTPIDITLWRASGSGNLGGTLTRTTSSGCATFDDLTYDTTETIQLMASSPGFTSVFSPFYLLPSPDPVPAGACLAGGGGWSTLFGGCYNSTLNLVVSAISPTTMPATGVGTEAFWRVSSASSTDIDLHDWPVAGGNDGNSDGIPDEYDAASLYFIEGTLDSGNGYCHNLIEGGYQDWRLPTYAEMQGLAAQGAVGKAKTLAAWYWISHDEHPSPNLSNQGRPDTGAKQQTTAWVNQFCVRDGDPAFNPPKEVTGFSAVATNYANINLSWTEPVSGNFSGYYLYYAIDPAQPNTSAPPQQKLKKGTTSYAMQGIQPGTKYNILMRTVWTNHDPIITDGNNTVYTATTPAKPGTHILKVEAAPIFRDNNNVFFQTIKICNRDDFNILQTLYPIKVTLSLFTGAGTLGGTLSKIASNGCATFTDVTYDLTEAIVIRASAPGFTSVDTPTLNLTPPDGGVVPGFCGLQGGAWSTGFGGCYNSAMNLSVSKKAITTHTTSSAFWEGKADLSDVDLHDWPVAGGNDGDNDGIPDGYDPTSSVFQEGLQDGSGYCHNLDEGGYVDWRLPTFAEFDNITDNYNFSWTIVSAQATYCWTSSDDSAVVGTANGIYSVNGYGTPQIGQVGSKTVFCFRDVETNFMPPAQPTGFAGIPGGAGGEIDLSWTAPATGTYSGFYVYYSIDPANPNLGAAPQLKVKKGEVGVTVTGLTPATTYRFVIRSVYTNHNPEVTDDNTTVIIVTAP